MNVKIFGAVTHPFPFGLARMLIPAKRDVCMVTMLVTMVVNTMTVVTTKIGRNRGVDSGDVTRDQNQV